MDIPDNVRKQLSTDFPEMMAQFDEINIPPVRTNADRLRAMSNERLSLFLRKVTYCPRCPCDAVCEKLTEPIDCGAVLLAWLNSEDGAV